MTLILGNGTDLARASRLASWLHRVPIDRVIVSLPWLDPREQLRAARLLRSRFNDCGCAHGTVAFALLWSRWRLRVLLSRLARAEPR